MDPVQLTNGTREDVEAVISVPAQVDLFHP
jgi:hypothetical protein